MTSFTANDKSFLDDIPALMRVGRFDKKVELIYCTDEQIVRLFNHYSYPGEKLVNHEFKIQITPAEVVNLILSNIDITQTEFELRLKSYEKVIGDGISFKLPMQKTKFRLNLNSLKKIKTKN